MRIRLTPKQRQAVNDLEAAKDVLEDVFERDREETDAYLEANQAVIDAEQAAKAAGVPWWRR